MGGPPVLRRVFDEYTRKNNDYAHNDTHRPDNLVCLCRSHGTRRDPFFLTGHAEWKFPSPCHRESS